MTLGGRVVERPKQGGCAVRGVIKASLKDHGGRGGVHSVWGGHVVVRDKRGGVAHKGGAGV